MQFYVSIVDHDFVEQLIPYAPIITFSWQIYSCHVLTSKLRYKQAFEVFAVVIRLFDTNFVAFHTHNINII